MRSKSLLIAAIVLCASSLAMGQSTGRMVDEFLGNPLQSPDVVTFQLQHFLMLHSPQLPHPSSADQWTAEEKRIRDHVLNDVLYHGWPQEWVNAPPKFQDLGPVNVPAGRGYKIEKFRYEVVPGFYSTALLYQPEHLQGKAPGVLDVLGHFPTGKASAFEQKLCINQALRGMIALSTAFIDMGELHLPGNEHYYGSDLDLVGVNGAGLFYLAMRRGLDYLYNDPHVDRSRIGVTGLSGGGWQTIMISSLDPRVEVAIPVAGFTGLPGRLQRLPGEPGDYEQLVPGLLAGQGYKTFAAMRAPRPTLEINNAEDTCCFRAPLVKPEIFTPIKPFFGLFGKADNLQFYDSTQISAHNYGPASRERAYAFLDKYFHLNANSKDIPVSKYVKTYSELAAGIPHDNLTILSLAQQFAGKLQHQSAPSDPNARAAWAEKERPVLKQITHYQPVTVEHPWFMTNTHHSNVESISFRFQMSNGLSATGVWTKLVTTPDDAPLVVVINDEGRAGADQMEWDNAQEVPFRMDQGDQVLALSLLFTGDATPSDADSFGYMLTSVNRPPLGLEAAQLIGITEWAKDHWHAPTVTLESEGYRMQVVGLVAGALEPHLFKSITTQKGMPSLQYLIDQHVRSSDAPDMFCEDLYKDFDIDSLSALSTPTRVNQSHYVTANQHHR